MGNSSWLPFPQNLWMQPFCSTCLADDTEEWMFYWTHPYFTVIIPFSQPQTEAWLPGQLNHAFGVYSLHHCVALTYAEKWMDSYLWRNCKHRTTWLSWPGNQASVCGWENGLAWCCVGPSMFPRAACPPWVKSGFGPYSKLARSNKTGLPVTVSTLKFGRDHLLQVISTISKHDTPHQGYKNTSYQMGLFF